MSDRMEYQVELLKDGRFDTYESASLFADSDDDAVVKAKAWANSFEGIPEYEEHIDLGGRPGQAAG
jgi:hypothetical protein